MADIAVRSGLQLVILPNLTRPFVRAVSNAVNNFESGDITPHRGNFLQWHRCCCIANRGLKSDELSQKNISPEKAKLIVR